MSNRFFQYIAKIFGSDLPKTGLTIEELLQREILLDKTFSITAFKSFQVVFDVEFNDTNYAHLQSLIEKGQTADFNPAEFTDEHTLDLLSVASFKAQDDAVYVALFFDPVDLYSNPELLRIYKIA